MLDIWTIADRLAASLTQAKEKYIEMANAANFVPLYPREWDNAINDYERVLSVIRKVVNDA